MTGGVAQFDRAGARAVTSLKTLLPSLSGWRAMQV